jgi:hypothetical protein
MLSVCVGNAHDAKWFEEPFWKRSIELGNIGQKGRNANVRCHHDVWLVMELEENFPQIYAVDDVTSRPS